MNKTCERRIKSFVLRQGRFSKGQKDAFEKLGPRYIIQYKNKLIDYKELFGNNNPLIIEIGFGSGSVTAEIAERNKNCNYIGIEVYKPGVGNLLKHIARRKLDNVRIFNHDAVEIIDSMIKNNSVDGFHVFFPDPWHKKKHNKRRLLNPEFTEKLASSLKKGGYIYAVTDWKDYAYQMQEVFRACQSLESPFEGFAYINSTLLKENKDAEQNTEQTIANIPWRSQTRFEEKGLKKYHEIYESYFIKK